MQGLPALKLGARGQRVVELQQWLVRHGYYTDRNGEDLPVDGVFGPRTKLAVLFAQRESGLKEDGIVGPATSATFQKRDQTIDRYTDLKYASERYNPSFKKSLNVSLVFNGKFLTMRANGKIVRYIAVSGVPKNGNQFEYSKQAQTLKSIGPIPEGTYWICPAELWRNKWWSPRRKSSWGNFAITIHPYLSTVTHYRGGFFIHGGSSPGSKGCIDLTTAMDRFVEDLLLAVGDEPKCAIPLRVKYETPW